MAASADNGIANQIDSTDAMREKLEKWRRMKGKRSACQDAATVNVYNRSKSSVALRMTKKNKSITDRSLSSASLVMTEKNKKDMEKKRHMKDLFVQSRPGRMTVQRGYKRISDGSENSICPKKKRESFLLEKKKPLGVNGSPDVVSESTKTYKNKSLSMSERLQLWRAEKRKSNPSNQVDMTPKPMVTRMKKKSFLKENMPQYQKLENESGTFFTVKKTRFVTPCMHKNSTMKPSVFQSNVKSSVRTPHGFGNSNAAFVPEKDTSCKADIAESYRNKSLDMRERLELWLAEKGKTPKYKTPAMVNKARKFGEQNLEEKKRLSYDGCRGEKGDNQTGQFDAISPSEGESIEEKVQDCLVQLENVDCDKEKVAAKLDLYNSSCPHTTQISNYWLCRAKIAQLQNDYDRVVCLFEQALVFKAQPESTVKDAVCDFVKFMKENSNRGVDNEEISQVPETPVDEARAVNDENVPGQFNSSIIKFCLTEATPYRKKFQQTYGKPVLTPVRRSIRLERVSSQHPSLLHEHDLTVRRLSELPEDIQQNLFFKPNFAVPAELNEAWRKLQLDFTE
ncbi:cytoskeleton-associated protein 2-like [Montipora capricornis]|uniref:cytoskeleton-associated protein 2-like n=1 Tax=Montipora capricornis TaxID=246305 RepID=UPI0035F145E3